MFESRKKFLWKVKWIETSSYSSGMEPYQVSENKKGFITTFEETIEAVKKEIESGESRYQYEYKKIKLIGQICNHDLNFSFQDLTLPATLPKLTQKMKNELRNSGIYITCVYNGSEGETITRMVTLSTHNGKDYWHNKDTKEILAPDYYVPISPIFNQIQFQA